MVAYFKIPLAHFPAGTKETANKIHYVSNPTFLEPTTSWIQVHSVATIPTSGLIIVSRHHFSKYKSLSGSYQSVLARINSRWVQLFLIVQYLQLPRKYDKGVFSCVLSISVHLENNCRLHQTNEQTGHHLGNRYSFRLFTKWENFIFLTEHGSFKQISVLCIWPIPLNLFMLPITRTCIAFLSCIFLSLAVRVTESHGILKYLRTQFMC
jgi:hypothetical protein